MALKIIKSDFLGEACKTTAVNVRCLCTDLTLLLKLAITEDDCLFSA